MNNNNQKQFSKELAGLLRTAYELGRKAGVSKANMKDVDNFAESVQQELFDTSAFIDTHSDQTDRHIQSLLNKEKNKENLPEVDMVFKSKGSEEDFYKTLFDTPNSAILSQSEKIFMLEMLQNEDADKNRHMLCFGMGEYGDRTFYVFEKKEVIAQACKEQFAMNDAEIACFLKTFEAEKKAYILSLMANEERSRK